MGNWFLPLITFFSNVLPFITFFPLAVAVIVMFIPKERAGVIRTVSIVLSFIPLVLSIWMWINCSYGAANQFPHASQFSLNVPWIPSLGVTFAMGVDTLSIPLIFLTTLLTTLCLIYSTFIENRPKEYYWMFLVLETGMLGVFTSLDFVLFFVFWELSLVPMYFLIGIWGGPRREYAAIKFFLYTMVGSMGMLLAMLAMAFSPEVMAANGGHASFAMSLIAKAHPFAHAAGLIGPLVFWGLFVGFAIKVPMWPFHTWLPDAHVEAPTAGSVILAGVLLKMGSYGFMRILMPMMPNQFRDYWFVVAILALVAIIYGAFVAMAQKDLKKLIAYSSVNHMGYVTLGCAIAAATHIGTEVTRAAALNGAQMQAFSHGLITGALFFLVGVVYERAHTRDLSAFGGLGARVPIYAGMLAFCSFGSLGLPGMTGFIAELSVLTGTYAASPLIAGLALIGIVVTAAYMLWMLQRVLLGALNPKYEKMPDADGREIVSLVPLMALMLFFGIIPGPVLHFFNTASQAILSLAK